MRFKDILKDVHKFNNKFAPDCLNAVDHDS